MMSSANRIRMLAGMLGVSLLAAGVLDEQSTLQAPFRTRALRIRELAEQRTQQERILQRRDEQSKELGQWVEKSLPVDESKAAAVYYPYLTTLAGASGLRQVAIAPGGMDDAKADVRWMRVTLTAEASHAAWARFFQLFQRTELLQSIASWDLQEAGNGDLRGSLAIEAACLRGRADMLAPAVPSTVALPPTLLGSVNWFSFRNVAVPSETVLPPTPVPQVAEPVELTGQRPEEPPVSLVLVGTWISPTRNEAWFFDTRDQRSVVLLKGRDFDVEGQKGVLLTVDRGGVTLRVGGRDIRVVLGEVLPWPSDVRLTAR